MNKLSEIKIMDVTLRDGGYRNNFNFSEDQIKNIISTLDEVGVEYIEIGYRNGSLKAIANIGHVGLCRNEYVYQCRQLIKNSKMVVMLHAKNVGLEDLEQLQNAKVDLLRICITKNNYKENFSMIKEAKKMGFLVSANITRISHYTEAELDELLPMALSCNIDMLYFADSNGSMLPTQVESLYKKHTQKFSIPFGFHAHDNLGLAQANSIAALSGGASYVDASLSGLGKGVGNLKYEFFTAYLHAMGVKKYNISKLLNISNFVRNTLNQDNTVSMKELMMGILDLSIDDIEKLSHFS